MRYYLSKSNTYQLFLYDILFLKGVMSFEFHMFLYIKYKAFENKYNIILVYFLLLIRYYSLNQNCSSTTYQ